MGVLGAEARRVLVGPGMFPQEDVGILEALEEDLEAAWFRWEGLLLPIEFAAVPKGVVEGFGG